MTRQMSTIKCVMVFLYKKRCFPNIFHFLSRFPLPQHRPQPDLWLRLQPQQRRIGESMIPSMLKTTRKISRENPIPGRADPDRRLRQPLLQQGQHEDNVGQVRRRPWFGAQNKMENIFF